MTIRPVRSFQLNISSWSPGKRCGEVSLPLAGASLWPPWQWRKTTGLFSYCMAPSPSTGDLEIGQRILWNKSNYMQNIKTCYRSLGCSGTHGLRLQGEGQTKQLYQLYKLKSVQFLCGFSWERCRTATMQSDLCHCPLQSERVRSPHNAPRGRDTGHILWVQTLTITLYWIAL